MSVIGVGSERKGQANVGETAIHFLAGMSSLNVSPLSARMAGFRTIRGNSGVHLQWRGAWTPLSRGAEAP